MLRCICIVAATILIISDWFLSETFAQVLINERLSLIETKTDFSSTPVEGAPAGSFIITATFENASTESLIALAFQVAQLTGGNLLLSADGGAGSVGSTLTVPFANYSGGLLRPGESFSISFIIGLGSKKRFRFFVDALGALGTIMGPEGGVVTGSGGTSVTIAPDSINYEAVISIAPTEPSDIVAPLGDLRMVAAVEIIFQPTDERAHFLPPSVPLQISVPAPPDMPEGAELIVAQQVLTDFIGETESGLREQLVPVDMASVMGGNIVTQTDVLPGIFGGGVFAIVQASGSGFATGTVSEEECSFVVCRNVPRPGVRVSNDTNTLVSITNADGVYILFITGGPFTATGFNPFRGSSGSANGNIAVDGSTVTANIRLSPLTSPPITRDGVRNGGFERSNLSSWATAGAVHISAQLGPTSTGVVIRPTEGQFMADINTGPGAVGEVGSSLKQRFIVPAGVEILQLDFNFVSEEFPEFVGTAFDDAFRALITAPNGQTTIARVSVNQSGGFTEIGDCFFPGGDNTCGQTGWRTAAVDISGFAGTNIPIIMELLFSASDVDDDLFDTHVLVDNIRFGTVFVDAKIINGANANQARILADVLQANEILSQAGLNVRLRNTRTINDPGSLLDTDHRLNVDCRTLFIFDCKFVRTAEERQLLGLQRSASITDLNVYHITSFTGSSAAATAIGPDDYHDVGIRETGIIMTDNVVLVPEALALAHEIGHILISPDKAGSSLEHKVKDVNNTMRSPGPGTVLSRQQSANINRRGAHILIGQ
jgi:hypothetical protein